MGTTQFVIENSITKALHGVAGCLQSGSPFVPAPEFIVCAIHPEVLPQVPVAGSFLRWELHGAELRLKCKIEALGAVAEEPSCCVGFVHNVDTAQWPAFLLAVNEAFPLTDTSFSVSLKQSAPIVAEPVAEPVASPTAGPVASAKEDERARREARAAKFGLAASVAAAEKTAENLKTQAGPVAAPVAAQTQTGVKLSAASPWGQRTEPIANSRRTMVMPSARPVACTFHARGACAKGAACPFSHEAAMPTKNTTVVQEMLQEKKKLQMPVPNPQKKPATGGRRVGFARDLMAPGPAPMDTTTGVTGKIKKPRRPRRRAPATPLRPQAPEFVPAARRNP